MDRATEVVPASAEYILEVLRDCHRHQCSFDPETEPDVELTFDTTVAEWRDACDLVGTKKLAEALNDDWGLTIPPSEWRAVLEPPTSRTLRDVCDLVASQATQANVLSVGHFGASSKAAGAFLAVRSLLLRAGANPKTVRPSLPVADVARRFPAVFLGPISKLAPGRLPTVAIRTPIYHAFVAIFGVGLLGLMGLMVAGWFGFSRWRAELAVAFAIVAAVGFVGTWIAARLTGPTEVRFGTVVTFRDLAEVIGGDQPKGSHHNDADAGRLA